MSLQIMLIVIVCMVNAEDDLGDLDDAFGSHLELGEDAWHGSIVGTAKIASLSYVKHPIVTTTIVKQPVLSFISKPVKTVSYISKPVISIKHAPVISTSSSGSSSRSRSSSSNSKSRAYVVNGHGSSDWW